MVFDAVQFLIRYTLLFKSCFMDLSDTGTVESGTVLSLERDDEVTAFCLAFNLQGAWERLVMLIL